eukprot:SAG25_NODE_1008_length_4323_cov_5.595206_5_plen_126_part_00
MCHNRGSKNKNSTATLATRGYKSSPIRDIFYGYIQPPPGITVPSTSAAAAITVPSTPAEEVTTPALKRRKTLHSVLVRASLDTAPRHARLSASVCTVVTTARAVCCVRRSRSEQQANRRNKLLAS